MHRIRAYLGTALCLVFNKLWLDPHKAGAIMDEHTVEAVREIYPDTDKVNGTSRTMLAIQRDWIQKFNESFYAEIKEYLD